MTTQGPAKLATGRSVRTLHFFLVMEFPSSMDTPCCSFREARSIESDMLHERIFKAVTWETGPDTYQSSMLGHLG